MVCNINKRRFAIFFQFKKLIKWIDVKKKKKRRRLTHLIRLKFEKNSS